MRLSLCCFALFFIAHFNASISFSVQKPFSGLFSNLTTTKSTSPKTSVDSIANDKNKIKYILIPPPNPDGDLHIGNALDLIYSDLLIRARELAGETVIPLFGGDSGGTKLIKKVDTLKRKSGKNETDELPSVEELDEYANKVRKRHIKTMSDLSLVWASKYMKDGRPVLDGLHTTCDKEMGVFANSVFNDLLKKNMAYKTEMPCSYYMEDDKLRPLHQNISADFLQECTKYTIELPNASSESNSEPLKMDLYELEMMFAYSAILVGDDSKNPANSARLPLVDREVPVIRGYIKDPLEPFWIKGLVPCHRPAHYLFAKKMAISGISVIDNNRRMINVPSWLYGLDRFYARQLIADRLAAAGLLKAAEPSSRYVGLDLNGEEATFLPLSRWLFKSSAGKDYSITRSCYYGHHADKEPEDSIFDVWFISSLWPFYIYNLTVKEPPKDGPLIDYLCCGKDLIEKWVRNIRELSEFLIGKNILSKVHFHKLLEIMKEGPFETPHGKMNKSDIGAIPVDEMIKKYGSDATRIYLASLADKKQSDVIVKDIKFSEFCTRYSKICIKAVNIAKYYKTRLDKTSTVDCKLTKLFDNAADALFHLLIKMSESWNFAFPLLKLKSLVLSVSNILVGFEKNTLQAARLVLKISKILSVYVPTISATIDEILAEAGTGPISFSKECGIESLSIIDDIRLIRYYIRVAKVDRSKKYICKLRIDNTIYSTFQDLKDEISVILKKTRGGYPVTITEVEITPSEDVDRFEFKLVETT